jgi:citrate synthase
MTRRRTMRSGMGWSSEDRIVVRGKDLAGEILGRLNFGDMAFLELTGRTPNGRESKLFNAMLVTLVEHGITPSALAARLTYLGAPEALQAAVAAGLCGLGSVFVGSTEDCAKMLFEELPDPRADVDLKDLMRRIVRQRARIPGIGHPVHRALDPRTPRLFEIARECGYYGRYCELIEAIAAEKRLPLNATGAIGALACEMGLDWKACRGLGVMARAVGLVGHLLEETREPMAQELWFRAEAEASAHLKPKSKP